MLRNSKLAVGLVLAWLLIAPPIRAQESSMDDLKKEIQSLNQTIKQMQKDLQEIKALLKAGQQPTRAAPPQKVLLELDDNPSQGDRAAKLTLIEFSDYQWPYCARHVRETAPQITKEYIETGKLRHVFMDFPLESMHKFAFKAAEAANCAGEQGKYWEMHDEIFANQRKMEPWADRAKAIGLDVPKFEECLNSGRQAKEIRRDMAEGQKAGVTGTPAFFLAYTDPKSSKVTTAVRITGARPFASFKSEIDKLLAGEPEAKKPEAKKAEAKDKD